MRGHTRRSKRPWREDVISNAPIDITPETSHAEPETAESEVA
jgi:hypothetical protein